MEEDDRRPVFAAREVAAHLAQAGGDEGGNNTAISASTFGNKYCVNPQ